MTHRLIHLYPTAAVSSFTDLRDFVLRYEDINTFAANVNVYVFIYDSVCVYDWMQTRNTVQSNILIALHVILNNKVVVKTSHYKFGYTVKQRIYFLALTVDMYVPY